jgi:FkbM family methyltransferase
MAPKFWTRLDLRNRARRFRQRLDVWELESMCRALQRGDAALDVGAHKGAYTYWMRRSVGTAGQVIAFEPQPELAAYLASCVAAFAWHNVVVENLALSSAAGEGTLDVPGEGPSGSARLVDPGSSVLGRRFTVPVRTLDGYLGDHPLLAPLRLIKIDVEGHELDVFNGAVETLVRYRPILLFECEQRHDSSRTVASVFAYLHELGYEGSFAWDGRTLPVDAFRPEEHQIFGRKPYVNNFVFMSAAR